MQPTTPTNGSKLWILGVLLSFASIATALVLINSRLTENRGILVGLPVLALAALIPTIVAKKRGSRRALWWLLAQIPCLILVCIYAIGLLALAQPISSGTYVNQSLHYSVTLPPGFVAIDKGLLIGYGAPVTQQGNTKHDSMVVIPKQFTFTYTADNIKQAEDGIIKNHPSSNIVARETTNNAHLLIIHETQNDRETYTGTYLIEGVGTAFYFAINCAKNSPQIPGFLQIAHSIKYVP